jgi:uncharacterized DUF497 family protein
MNEMFEWDPAKAEGNLSRHGVGFKTATEAFFDPDAIHFEDLWHSGHGEERRIVVGRTKKGILVVVYTERGPAIRIISARRAGPEERRLYEEKN